MACLARRGKTYYIVIRKNGTEKRKSLKTTSLQVAKAKMRQIELKIVLGNDNLFPTKTALADILDSYVRHVRTQKTRKGAATDICNLRNTFGPVCEGLQPSRHNACGKLRKKDDTSRSVRRHKPPRLQAGYLEDVTTVQVSTFLAELVQVRGLSPKTANRYREILHRLFNWSMKERGVRMPGDKNPVTAVSRYREKTSKITFLTMTQVNEQLDALDDYRQMQAMVAMYIYAGLRREEALWLQRSDVSFSTGRFGIIRVQAKDVNGKFWEPKTKSNRAVPISSDLRRYLEQYCPRPCVGDWYFPSPKGMQYDPDNFSSHLRRIQKLAGLPWKCLDFRHTFGSQLAMKGESLYKISTLLGNSPEICRRQYAALIPDEMIDTVEFSGSSVVSRIQRLNS